MRRPKAAGRPLEPPLLQFSRSFLQEKYAEQFAFFLSKPVNEILRQYTSTAWIRFSDNVIFDCKEEVLRRYYKASETEVRLKNYSSFYAKQPKAEPFLEKLNTRKITKKRRKRLEKLANRKLNEEGKEDFFCKKQRDVLTKLDSKTIYISDVPPSASSSIYFEEKKEGFAIPERTVRPIDHIKKGEVWDVYEEDNLFDADFEEVFLDVKPLNTQKRSVSIPTEISDLAHLPESEIFQKKGSTFDQSSIFIPEKSCENTLKIFSKNTNQSVRKQLRIESYPIKKPIEAESKALLFTISSEQEKSKKKTISPPFSPFSLKGMSPSCFKKQPKSTNLQIRTIINKNDYDSAFSKSRPFNIVDSHNVLIQKHVQKKRLFEGLKSPREFETSPQFRTKQTIFALSEKLKAKLQEKSTVMTKKILQEAKAPFSPSERNLKCQTERNLHRKKPASLSNLVRAQMKSIGMPGLFSSKDGSVGKCIEVSSSFKNNMFGTFRPGLVQKKLDLFKNFVASSNQNTENLTLKPCLTLKPEGLDSYSPHFSFKIPLSAKNGYSNFLLESTNTDSKLKINQSKKSLNRNKKPSISKKQKNLG